MAVADRRLGTKGSTSERNCLLFTHLIVATLFAEMGRQPRRLDYLCFSRHQEILFLSMVHLHASLGMALQLFPGG